MAGTLGLRRTTGNVPSKGTVVVLGPIEEEHIIALENQARHASAPPLQRLRERHHALAREIALGATYVEAAYNVGYEPNRVRVLKDDPVFADLVRYYRKKAEAEFVDSAKQLAGFHKDVVLELRDRLEFAPDDFSIGQLTNLMVVTADRIGLGPSSKSEVNVTVGLADRMREARRRIEEQRRMIDVTPAQEAAE